MLWAASEVLAAGYPPEASFCKCPSYAHRLFPRKAVEKVYFTGRRSNVVVSLLEKPSQGSFSCGLPVPGGSQGPRVLFSVGSVVGWDGELAPDLSGSCTFEGRGT